MTPEQILLKCGLHPSKISKYVVSVEPPLPRALQNKRILKNIEQGLTTHGETRKRTLRYTNRATGCGVRL